MALLRTIDDIPTAELVEELKKRNNVESFRIEKNEYCDIIAKDVNLGVFSECRTYRGKGFVIVEVG